MGNKIHQIIQSIKRISKSRRFIIALAVILLDVISLNCYTVPEGCVGVIRRHNKVLPEEKMPGFVMTVPWIDSLEIVNVKPITINYTTRKVPKEKEQDGIFDLVEPKHIYPDDIVFVNPVKVLNEGLVLAVELTVQYRLKPSLAAETIATYGEDYQEKLIHPVVREVVRDVIADYPPKLIPLKRAEIEQRITKGIKSRLSYPRSPVVILSVQFRGVWEQRA